MNEQKQIGQERWPDYLGQVTAGNRGRLIAVDIITPTDIFPEPQINILLLGSPLLALEYEPVKKGNAIILSVGEDAVEYEHAVDAPVVLTENLEADGSLDSLEILDQNGARTKLNFFD